VENRLLRLGAAVAEVEGLYNALLDADTRRGKRRLRWELSSAAQRLANLAAADTSTPVSARRRRRMLVATRGADWVTARFGPAA
jgi:hypothetical protein